MDGATLVETFDREILIHKFDHQKWHIFIILIVSCTNILVAG